MLEASDQFSPHGEPGGGALDQSSAADWLAYARGFARRQFWVAFLFVVLGTGLGAFYLLNTKPNFTATATLLLDTRKFQFSQQPVVLPQMSLESSAAVESQLEIIRSEEIARTVVKKLQLSEDPEFVGTGRGIKAMLLGGLFAPAQPPTEAERVERTRAVLAKNLTVNRAGNSYAIEIGFDWKSADRAAQVANAVADAYIDQQLASQYSATRQASDWLESRIRELRDQSLVAQRAVVEYKTKNNIVETATGQLVSDQHLAELTSQLDAARTATNQAKIRFDQLDAITRATAPDAIVNASIGGDAQNENLAKLRLQYRELADRTAEWSVKYGPNHLAVVDLRNQMLQIRSGILAEFEQLKASSKSDYEIAQLRESGLKQELAEALSQSQTANHAQGALRQLEASAQTYKALYDSFLSRYADSLQEQSSPVAAATVITRASPPDSRNYKKTFAIAALFPIAGLALGFGIAMLREHTRRVFWTAKLIESSLHVPCLGILPRVGDAEKPLPRVGDAEKPLGSTQVALSDAAFEQRWVLTGGMGVSWTVVARPFSRFSDGVRAIKLAVDVGARTRSNKVVGFTSALPNEGKSTIALAFGQHIARTGARVIVVDGDLRNPSLTKSIAPGATSGILELIAGQVSFEEIVWKDRSTQMEFLPAVLNHELADTYEILASNGMNRLVDELRTMYDFVVVDLSPLAPIVDVSATARFVDSYVLVVEWGSTTIDVVEHALRGAPSVYESLIGAVLNKVDVKQLAGYDSRLMGYYYNMHYRRYGYVDT
jgi:succinoglycan biosynthesis transport protein ExoP